MNYEGCFGECAARSSVCPLLHWLLWEVAGCTSHGLRMHGAHAHGLESWSHPANSTMICLHR